MKQTVRKTAIILVLSMVACAQTAMYAQKEVTIAEVTVINMGDGRLLYRDAKNEKPLEGKHRIIDGYRSEYLLADFVAGRYNGTFQYFKRNNLVQEGNYSDGVKNGVWKEYYDDGKSLKSETPIKNGKLDGVLKTYFSDGEVESETGYKDGLQHGKELRYYYEAPHRLTVEANYVDGKPDGKQTRHYISNTGDYVEIAYFDKGIPTGEYSKTYNDGAVKEKGAYKNGKKEGAWETYKEDGTRKPTEVYENGNVVKRITYYTDGKVEMERNFDENGKQHGVEKKYDYNDGLLKTELNYVHGKQFGKQVRYMYSNAGNFIETSYCDESGKKCGEYTEIFIEGNHIKTRGKYVDDRKHGKWTYGYENGVIYKEETYDNGTLTETKNLKR